MSLFRKKKDKELEKLGIDEDEIIGLGDDEQAKDEEQTVENVEELDEIEKNFIINIPDGCPICAGEVKGNDYYKYFCENCNVLFDKKDVIDKEFGKSIREVGVRKTRLTDEERKVLEQKRKELKERVFKEFSERKKKQLVKIAEEKKREEAEKEPDEAEAEIILPYEPEEEVLEEESTGLEDALEGRAVQEAETEEKEPEDEEGEPEEEPAEAEERPKKEEYELESHDRIIASKESTKMHVGDCHFVKKIHPDNRIYLDSTDEGEGKGYEMCVCLRRKRASGKKDI